MQRNEPVAARLERRLNREVELRGLVVWVDPAAVYRGFVGGWAAKAAGLARPVEVITYAGSWLEWMTAVEGRAGAVSPERLVLYMPGLTLETLDATPALELLLASGGGVMWALKEVVTEAAQGLATPEELARFLAERGAEGLTLEAAEAWLRAVRAEDADAVGQELDDWGVARVVDNLLGDDRTLAGRVASSTAEDALERVRAIWSWMGRHLGADAAFARFYLGHSPGTYLEVVDLLAAWLMCVEFVHDLKRLPKLAPLNALRALPAPLVQTCREEIQRVRERYADTYAVEAAGVEAHLAEELENIQAEELGQIDTFQAEEQRVVEGALAALEAGAWASAQRWAEDRQARPSFWVKRDAARRFEWTLIGAIAHLGARMDAAPRPLRGAAGWSDAVARYVEDAAPVDAAHRALEQQRAALLRPHLSAFAPLLQAANRMRELHRAWSNTLAEDFAAVGEQVGFLPGPELQQRRIFEEVIAPRVQEGRRVAVLVLDGLRYEMAAELAAQLTAEGVPVDLRARLAEVPTVAAVGLNALAPIHQQGRLELAGSGELIGFRAGELVIGRHDARVRAWAERLVDPTAARRRRLGHYTLAEVCERPLESLRQGHGGADVLLVSGREDGAGPLERLEHLEGRLGQIVAAWRQLRQLGFDTFVFTADHGALRRDETTETLKPPPGALVVHRRYALLAQHEPPPPGCLSLPLAELGYTGRSGAVVTPRRTQVFQTDEPDGGLVSGGLSPQERVLPVLVVEQRDAPLPERVHYALQDVTAEPDASGHVLRLRVEPAKLKQSSLSFTQPEPVRLILRSLDAEAAQVTLTEARSGAVQNQMIVAPIGVWVEVLFEVAGPREERIRLELAAAPGESAQLAPHLLKGYVAVRAQGKASAAPAAPRLPDDWAASFDEATARALRHIERHGAITEEELTNLLGSPRAARRFANGLDAALERLPFGISTDHLPSGAKRYKKD